MQQFLLRMEAVNLSASIFDTEDLSAIRGGSVACLELPRKLLDAVAVHERYDVFSGASQAVVLVEVEDGVDQADLEAEMVRLACGRVPVEGLARSLADALPFVPLIGVAVPFEGKLAEADARAVARLRRRQLSQPTIDLPTRSTRPAMRPCAIDGMRPAAREVTKGGETLHVSESVAVRRRLGVEGRRAIYGREAPEATGQLAFADSFLELVEHAPRGLPPSLSGKMAVIKLDGNKFGKSRSDFIKASDDAGAAAGRFSAIVVAARRRFLSSLLAALTSDARMFTPEGRLRFETLMWGGDESLFVLPAWKVRDVLDVIASDMAGDHWSLEGGLRLTTGYGILVCSAKMPIAIAKSLTESLLDSAKSLNTDSELRDRLSVQMIESIEAPAGDVNGLRRQLYGTFGADAFTLGGADNLFRYLEVCNAVTDPGGLPRSQLQWLLSLKRSGETLETDDLLRDAVRRSRADTDEETARRDTERVMALLKEPVLGTSPGCPFLPYQRLAELWDLLRPFPAPLSTEAV